MKLGPQTEVPKVKSYLDKSAARARRFCGAPTVRVRYFASDVFPLIYTDVGDNDVLVALAVHRRAACVPHSCDTTKIGDNVWIRIHGVKRGVLVGRTGKETGCTPVGWHYVPTGKRNWLDLEIGYQLDLGRQR